MLQLCSSAAANEGNFFARGLESRVGKKQNGEFFCQIFRILSSFLR